MSNKNLQLIIKNGRLIDPANNIDQNADILINDGKIAAIETANTIDENNGQTIDASGLIVSPGFIDCCARLR